MDRYLRLFVSFMVTWKIVGDVSVPCAQGQPMDPYSGLCAQHLDITRSAYFDHKEAAETAIKQMKKSTKGPSYTISDIHLYSEEGAK
jgi:hypothetical protein